jgi:hypothetical protein
MLVDRWSFGGTGDTEGLQRCACGGECPALVGRSEAKGAPDGKMLQ